MHSGIPCVETLWVSVTSMHSALCVPFFCGQRVESPAIFSNPLPSVLEDNHWVTAAQLKMWKVSNNIFKALRSENTTNAAKWQKNVFLCSKISVPFAFCRDNKKRVKFCAAWLLSSFLIAHWGTMWELPFRDWPCDETSCRMKRHGQNGDQYVFCFCFFF